MVGLKNSISSEENILSTRRGDKLLVTINCRSSFRKLTLQHLNMEQGSKKISQAAVVDKDLVICKAYFIMVLY